MDIWVILTLTIMINATLNSINLIQAFVWTYVPFLLDIYLRVDLLGNMLTLAQW